MDLKKFLPGGDKEDSLEYFWSMIVEPGWVQAGIWRIKDQKAQIVFTSLASAWELDQELVNAADASLSSAIQNFPSDVKEPTKTVFGVSAVWVKEGQIAEEYLEKLKNLCSELSLTPIGFVVIPEAIAHLVKSEEGSPLNAIVVGLYSKVVEVSVFKLGNLAGTTQVARSVALEDDVSEGLSRFGKVDSFPSRFILYDGREGDLEEARQNLLKVNWEDFEKIKFLHTPKMEIFDSVKKVYAVSLAGASELGAVSSVEGMKVEKSLDEEETKKIHLPENVTRESDEEENVVDSGVDPGKFGFMIDHDAAEDVGSETQEQTPIRKIEETEDAKFVEEAITPKPAKINLDNLKQKLVKPFSYVGSFLSAATTGKNFFVVGVGILLLLILLGGIFWWFYPKALVTVYVSPKRLEERIDLEVSISGEGRIRGELISTNVSGEKSKDTTGTKTVGDKAKGEVVLYRVGSEMSLDSGTIIRGTENLKFTLDSDVTIASGSASSPATATTEVTAQEIGAQYNLASGTSFAVSNYSSADIEAKSETSFSGGSSREINAVSKSDLEILEEQLASELTKEAESELLLQMSDDKIFIDSSLTTTTVRQVFNNKEGDEATTLLLDLELSAEGIVIDKGEFIILAQESLADKVPEGFIFREDQVDFSFEFDEKVGEVYKFTVRADVNLLPKVDTQVVAKNVSGKYPTLAEEYLTREVPGFVRAEIKLNPALPGRLGTLPRVVKNIEVEVAAEK